MACVSAGWLRHFNPPTLRPSKPGYRNRYPAQIHQCLTHAKRPIRCQLFGRTFMSKMLGQVFTPNLRGF